MEIKITNKIGMMVDLHQKKTGASKTFIASKMGMSSQNMYQLIRSSDISIKTLIKFSIVLGCDMTDLYEYEVIEED